MITNFIRDLKISRPGLWFATVWIYLVPLSFDDRSWEKPIFWIGFFFVTFPLNYLVYGLNDFNDVASDQLNERKGNFLFGAKASEENLKKIPLRITLALVPFIVFFTYEAGLYMFLLLCVMIVVNIIYNFRPFKIKERPPFEIFIQIGYVLIAVFSAMLNDAQIIPWQTILYLSLFAFQAHIAGEIMDIEPDILSRKKTTATLIGRKKTKYLMILLLALEVYILAFWFQDYILSGLLGCFAFWMILDVFIFFKGDPYSQPQMKLFGFAMNVVAIFTMIWVAYTGNLLHPL